MIEIKTLSTSCRHCAKAQRQEAKKQETVKKIKALWKTGEITQPQLAKIFNYSQSNISRIISEEEE